MNNIWSNQSMFIPSLASQHRYKLASSNVFRFERNVFITRIPGDEDRLLYSHRVLSLGWLLVQKWQVMLNPPLYTFVTKYVYNVITVGLTMMSQERDCRRVISRSGSLRSTWACAIWRERRFLSYIYVHSYITLHIIRRSQRRRSPSGSSSKNSKRRS